MNIQQKVDIDQQRLSTSSCNHLIKTLGAICLANQQRLTGAGDTKFLDSNQLSGITQPCLMIKGNTTDHCNIRINNIDGIEATAQPYFEKHNIQVGIGKNQQCGKSAKFKIGQGNFCTRRFNLCKSTDNRSIVNRLALNTDTLVVIDKMWRGGRTNPVTMLQHNRLHTGNTGAFAISTGNGNRGR